MGYSNPIGGVSRALSSTVFIHSAPFTRFDWVNFGSRMSVIKLSPENYVMYAAIPYDSQMIESLTNVIKDPEWLGKVTHVIIPDKEHTMGVLSYNGKLAPNAQVIGMKTANETVNKEITIEVTADVRDKVLGSLDLQQLGITDPLFLEQFKLVYVPSHLNQELLVHHSVSNTMFTGDLFFNMQADNSLKYPHWCEQFGGVNPATGYSFIVRYLNPNSRVGRYLFKSLIGGGSSKEAKTLVQLIYGLKFDSLVMCHGDVIESNASEIFKTGFPSFF